MIAMIIFYNHVIRYINKLTFLLLKYFLKENISYSRKIAAKGRRYANKIANISVTSIFRELKLVSNDCYENILQSCNKIYKQAYFLVAQIFKKT